VIEVMHVVEIRRFQGYRWDANGEKRGVAKIRGANLVKVTIPNLYYLVKF
jgi:hypothetical protein